MKVYIIFNSDFIIEDIFENKNDAARYIIATKFSGHSYYRNIPEDERFALACNYICEFKIVPSSE